MIDIFCHFPFVDGCGFGFYILALIGFGLGFGCWGFGVGISGVRWSDVGRLLCLSSINLSVLWKIQCILLQGFPVF